MLAILTLTFCEYTVKKLSVFEWQRRFREGRGDVQDDSRSWQPKTQMTDGNADRVQTLVCSERRLSVRLIAE
jgi:hypothetical protein